MCCASVGSGGEICNLTLNAPSPYVLGCGFGVPGFSISCLTRRSRTGKRLGFDSRHLPSGAGHDAQMMATLMPMGMILMGLRETVLALARG